MICNEIEQICEISLASSQLQAITEAKNNLDNTFRASAWPDLLTVTLWNKWEEENNIKTVRFIVSSLLWIKLICQRYIICFALCGLLWFHVSPRNAWTLPWHNGVMHWSWGNWSYEVICTLKGNTICVLLTWSSSESDYLFCPGWIPPFLIIKYR